MKKCFIFLMLLTLLMTGCGQKEIRTEPEKQDEQKTIEIGMSFDSFVIERWTRDRDIFAATAQGLGATINVQNANGDIEKQKEQIAYFVKKGVDVIVVITIDSDALTEDIVKAKNAGIRVIAYDRLVRNADVDLYISFDNEKVGTLMAEALIAGGAGKGPVYMLGGSETDYNVNLVEDGFHRVCEEHGITIGDSIHCSGWLAEIASDYVYQNAKALSAATGIMCGNDNIAGPVLRALAENQLAGKVPVVGQDADLEACQRIVEGTQLMTVYKPVEQLAAKAAVCAIALAKGEALPEEGLSALNDGSQEVPYIAIDPIAVTKENMDEVIIESGFHLKEDVYLNRPEELSGDTVENTVSENGK